MVKRFLFTMTALASAMILLCSSVSAAVDPDLDVFTDPKWGKWTRIHPQSEAKPYVLGNSMHFDLPLDGALYATGFISDEKVSSDSVTIEHTIVALPKDRKGNTLYDRPGVFSYWIMVGISDDHLKSNTTDWIWNPSGLYIMMMPQSATEMKFMLRYAYPKCGNDEIHKNKDGKKEGANGLVELAATKNLPINPLSKVKFTITKDDVIIEGDGKKYKFSEEQSDAEEAGKSGKEYVAFNPTIQEKTYNALGSKVTKCFAIYCVNPSDGKVFKIKIDKFEGAKLSNTTAGGTTKSTKNTDGTTKGSDTPGGASTTTGDSSGSASSAASNTDSTTLGSGETTAQPSTGSTTDDKGQPADNEEGSNATMLVIIIVAAAAVVIGAGTGLYFFKFRNKA